MSRRERKGLMIDGINHSKRLAKKSDIDLNEYYLPCRLPQGIVVFVIHEWLSIVIALWASFIPTDVRNIQADKIHIVVVKKNSLTEASVAAEPHWPEYLMEAGCLATFMLSACIFGVLLEYPQSRIHGAIGDPILRRALMGIAMGLTAVMIIFSPWGKRSGAHLNPAVTLTFLSLRKIKTIDAAFYVFAQCLGGIAGVQMADALLGLPLRDSSVNYVATIPRSEGAAEAFLAEAAISFLMMFTILTVSNIRELARFTPWFAGSLVAAFILVEAPISGMSMNPARSLGSAVAANEWAGFWVYVSGPLTGMIAAGRIYSCWRGLHRVFCAKLYHDGKAACLFRCQFEKL